LFAPLVEAVLTGQNDTRSDSACQALRCTNFCITPLLAMCLSRPGLCLRQRPGRDKHIANANTSQRPRI